MIPIGVFDINCLFSYNWCPSATDCSFLLCGLVSLNSNLPSFFSFFFAFCFFAFRFFRVFLDLHTKFYEKDPSNRARGIAKTFDVSKAYVDRLAQSGRNLTVHQAGSLERNVPLYLGLEFMGTLSSEIERLLNANEKKDVKKTLKYMELYTTMVVLKDVIMPEVATLLPEELEPNRQAMLAA